MFLFAICMISFSASYATQVQKNNTLVIGVIFGLVGMLFFYFGHKDSIYFGAEYHSDFQEFCKANGKKPQFKIIILDEKERFRKSIGLYQAVFLSPDTISLDIVGGGSTKKEAILDALKKYLELSDTVKKNLTKKLVSDDPIV